MGKVRSSTFQIHLDVALAYDFRKKINQHQHFSMKKNIDKTDINAWNKICAIMDRIDDTVCYLNSIILGKVRGRSTAFDFIDFLNNTGVLIECIDAINKIYDFKSKIKKTNSIFTEGKNNDDSYFKHIRSLCSVHPVSTNKHKEFLEEDDFQCCPRVVWNETPSITKEPCDLYAIVYGTQEHIYHKIIPIYLSELFDYIQGKYSDIKTVIEIVEQNNQSIKSELIKKPIKNEREFEDYADYLKSLNKCYNERVGSDNDGIFEFYETVFSVSFSDSKNQELLDKYKEAIKFSAHKFHDYIQKMYFGDFKCQNHQDEFENYFDLYFFSSNSDELKAFHYHLSKIIQLVHPLNSTDRLYIYSLINEMKCFFEKYITFEDQMSDVQLSVIISVALYIHSLENKSSLNRVIPNDLKFRKIILDNDRYNVIVAVEEQNDTDKDIVFQLLGI